MIRTKIDTLLVGKPQPFRSDDELSAIVKTPVSGAVYLGALGLEGNQVADMVHHGGSDKALHLYPIEHYSFWREKYPDLDLLSQPGAFGENFSCAGMTEDELCLGDIFRVGGALIQCSHARQPCWKLNHRFGKKDVLMTVIESTKSGSYFRVLQEGKVQTGNLIEQTDRPFPEWPLSRVFRLIIGGDYKGNEADLEYLAKTSVLADAWRIRAKQLLEMMR